jgi:hypothetical protein
MKIKIVLFVFLGFLSTTLTDLHAQGDKKEVPDGWRQGAGLGVDMSQLLQINPKVGAGQNRLGFGGAVNYFAKYKKKRLAWDNTVAWQFGVQRLGSGIIAQGTTDKIPFQKAIDELRFNSKIGFKAADTSDFNYAANLSFLSQLTKTFEGPKSYPGFYLSDITNIDPNYEGDPLQSKFFSPATITLSVGIDYNPADNLSIYYSPVGGKFIIVASDFIASKGVHGNPVRGMAVDGRYADFDNVDAQLGSLLRMNFSSNFMEEKMNLTSALTLFSNYVREPENIDVDWTNEINLKILKNIQLAFLVNVFYDHDVKVQITDYEFPSGIRKDEEGNPVTGRRVSMTQQLLIKYATTF